ncbi:MAG: hypothetical protein IKK75_11135 [Clostridia bacterium]|nr:hypothetical protein [Clostridia bacterium]
MKRETLDRAFGDTPEIFSARVSQTLLNLKEEKTMKHITLRAALIATLLTALLCGIAYAAFTQGMDWYYHNRFTAYQQYEPEKHQAIMENRQAVTMQSSPADALVCITVQEAAWVPEKQFLSIILSAVPGDEARYELHPMWNLDADGSYIGEGGDEHPDSDGIDRAVHWLWTEKGFGPIAQVMDDPQKQLLLFEASEAWLGETPMMGDGSSVDSFTGENGEIITVLEIQLTEEASRQMQSATGRLAVSIPCFVTPYTEDDEALYHGGETQWISFEITIP